MNVMSGTLPVWKVIKDSINSYSPGSQSFYKDVIFAMLCLFFQLFLLRGDFFFRVYLDVGTPLVTLIAIKASLKRSLFFSVWLGLLVETHSASPLGMYISGYWVISVVISLVKPHISWRYVSSWVYVIVISQSFIVFMKSFTIYMQSNAPVYNAVYFAQLFFQIGFSLLLFQFIPTKWKQGDFMEDRSW